MPPDATALKSSQHLGDQLLEHYDMNVVNPREEREVSEALL